MRPSLIVIPAVFVAATLRAQSADLPPIRSLGAPVATSPKTFRYPAFVRALSAGTLLVNDIMGRRVLLSDTTLRSTTVVVDSGAGAEASYGARPGGLIPYLGDSSVFVETATPLMYVIDPAGKVARTASVPVPRDAGWMTQAGIGGWPSSDGRGRLIYRGQAPRAPETDPPKVGEWQPFAFPDSAPIQRADFVTRRVETAAWYKTPKLGGVRTMRPGGTTHSIITGTPLRVGEEWSALSDGTIAILRSDYHLEFISPDGKTIESPRIPYPWQRMTDEAKVALIDSMKKAFHERESSPSTPMRLGSAGGGGSAPNLPALPADLPEVSDEVRFGKPGDIPDYRPAFEQGAVRADANDNLWIRTLQPPRTPKTAVYDVVDRTGKLIDRVELPTDRVIVGFDKTAVYLRARDDAGAWLERVRIR